MEYVPIVHEGFIATPKAWTEADNLKLIVCVRLSGIRIYSSGQDKREQDRNENWTSTRDRHILNHEADAKLGTGVDQLLCLCKQLK